MSSDVIFLQAKWSKIKERVKGWKSGKKTWFKRITVCMTKAKIDSLALKVLWGVIAAIMLIALIYSN